MNDATTLDVLMYLFEQCLADDLCFAFEDHEDALRGELRDAGFPERAVSAAFSWLGSLAPGAEADSAGSHTAASVYDDVASNDAGPGGTVAYDGTASAVGTRYYTESEQERLDTRCRGLLHSLEYMGLLDAEARERVIDRAMALKTSDLDVESLRWVVLVVLLNLPGREASCDWVEELLFTPDDGYAH